MAVFTGLGLGDERWVVGIVVEMSRKGDQSDSAVGTHSLQTKEFVPLASHFPLGFRTGVSQLLSLCSMYRLKFQGELALLIFLLRCSLRR